MRQATVRDRLRTARPMKHWITASLLFCIQMSCMPAAFADDWPQGPGPQFDFTTTLYDGPVAWSVVENRNIAWRCDLPETGQSAPVVHGKTLFVTTMKPVLEDSETGSAVVLYALSTEDGSIQWHQEIEGGYPTQLSAPFGDASAPSPVTDGKHVWVLNPTGKLACFDFAGNLQWQRAFTSVVRTQPILVDGKLIFHRQVYLPDDHGHFTHENANAPHELWTQLQAVDANTGEVVWTSACGVNMGCVPIVQRLSDGSWVMIVGRGGGHSPPEVPEGVSMIRLDNGKTYWTLALPGFMATQMYPIVNDHALVFHGGDHLWIDCRNGKIARQVSIVDNVTVRRWHHDSYQSVTESLDGSKPRSITQQSNIRIDDFHYFRAYTKNYLGRIHLQTGRVEYLELPLQILRRAGRDDQVLWNAEQPVELADVADLATKKKVRDLTTTSLRWNAVRNSRGFRVMGDWRSQANGWGHTASTLPSGVGGKLIVPLASGMVFVLDSSAADLDERALLGSNDLGELGASYMRASLTTDGHFLYAHTIQGVVAIGRPQ